MACVVPQQRHLVARVEFCLCFSEAVSHVGPRTNLNKNKNLPERIHNKERDLFLVTKTPAMAARTLLITQ